MYTSITTLNLLIYLFNSYVFWNAITESFDFVTFCLRVNQCFTVRICSRDNTFMWINRLIPGYCLISTSSVFIFIIIITFSYKIFVILFGPFVEFKYYQYYLLGFHCHHYYYLHETISQYD